MIKKKRLLVTGAAGFIGSNFVNKYHDKYEIYMLDSLSYAGKLENIDWSSLSHDNFYKMNILWAGDLVKVFSDIQPEVVVNFAAQSHVDNSIEAPLTFTPTNVLGVHYLLDMALKFNVEKYVQISTDEVYGHLGASDPSFTESTPLSPRSPYSATKASADLLVKAYHDTYGLNTCTTRCSNNFGPNQHEEKLIPKIIKNAIQNKPIPIYGNGKNVRDWIYVEDHVDGISAVIENGKSGEIYNFGASTEMENLDICRLILKILDKPESLIEFVEDRKGHDFRYSINSSKAKNYLGWNPKWDFYEALVKTIDFYKK
jgi:dTDP-glucose 4,6-dehydratase